MTSAQAVALLQLFSRSGIVSWVDGGWGVDALLGDQRRAHSDLDLVIPREAVAKAGELLEDDGFKAIRNWLPTAIAYRHPDGREVDLHPVDPTSDGGGDQLQLDGASRFHYEPPVPGTIGATPVLCSPVTTQVRAHLGYEPTETDRADLLALRDRFGLHLPPPYDDTSDS